METREWRQTIIASSALLAESFERDYSTAISQYGLLQQSRKKDALHYVYISYLRSSVLVQEPLFRLDLYGSRGLRDTQECWSYWDTGNVTDVVYQKYPYDQKIQSIQGVEESAFVDQERLKAAESFFSVFEEYVPTIVDAVRDRQDSKIIWNYGEYYGKTVRI